MADRKENIIILLDTDGEIREIDLNAFRKDKISFGRDASNNIVINSGFTASLNLSTLSCLFMITTAQTAYL